MNLKEIRLRSNKTQQEVAKIINKSPVAYGYYESGRNSPDIATLIKLADYFDVSLDYLCGRPRPYDLPSSATQSQRKVINEILQLDEEQTMLTEAYIQGLKKGREEREKTIKLLKGEN